MRLQRDAIVKESLALLEREGFDALSLRKIADALGVQAPALYWHVRNRAELYGLMAESLLREALRAVGNARDAASWLIAFGRALHELHMRRRDTAKLVAMATPTPAVRDELLVVIVESLMARGLGRERATQAQAAVQSFTLGWSLFQSNRAVDELMHQSMDVDAGFEAALAGLAGSFTAGVVAPRKAARR